MVDCYQKPRTGNWIEEKETLRPSRCRLLRRHFPHFSRRALSASHRGGATTTYLKSRLHQISDWQAVDAIYLRSFFATKSAFLAAPFSFNLLSEFQRAVDPALKSHKQLATLRFEVFTCAAILGRNGRTWFCTCPKTGAVICSVNLSSTAYYFSLRQLLRSSILR